MAYGWHYRWDKDEKYWVEPDEADEFFYMQLLAGDQQVDNIHGIKGIGLKTAKKILTDCPDNKSRYERCLEKYTEAGMTYWDLLENANLLWIQREKDKLWQPPAQ
jgi:5'-3' exonuclease